MIVIAKNSNGDSLSDTATITVLSVNDPPYVRNQPGTITCAEDSTATFDFSNVFGDTDGTVQSITTKSCDSVGIATQGSILTCTPFPNWNGYCDIVLTATDDSGAKSTATLTLHVTPVNDPPVFLTKAFDTTMKNNEQLHFKLRPLVKDIDNPITDLKFSCVPFPGINVIPDSTGLFIMPRTFIDTAYLRIIVSDGSLSDSATLKVYTNDPTPLSSRFPLMHQSGYTGSLGLAPGIRTSSGAFPVFVKQQGSIFLDRYGANGQKIKPRALICAQGSLTSDTSDESIQFFSSGNKVSAVAFPYDSVTGGKSTRLVFVDSNFAALDTVDYPPTNKVRDVHYLKSMYAVTIGRYPASVGLIVYFYSPSFVLMDSLSIAVTMPWIAKTFPLSDTGYNLLWGSNDTLCSRKYSLSHPGPSSNYFYFAPHPAGGSSSIFDFFPDSDGFDLIYRTLPFPASLYLVRVTSSLAPVTPAVLVSGNQQIEKIGNGVLTEFASFFKVTNNYHLIWNAFQSAGGPGITVYSVLNPTFQILSETIISRRSGDLTAGIDSCMKVYPFNDTLGFKVTRDYNNTVYGTFARYRDIISPPATNVRATANSIRKTISVFVKNGFLHVIAPHFPVSLSVYDLRGRSIRTTSLTEKCSFVRLGKNPAGMILVKLRGEGFEMSKVLTDWH
jgi:hypothetical protein